MDAFLEVTRYAFRTQHGLPVTGPPAALPAEAREHFFQWARRHRVSGLLQPLFPDLIPPTAVFGQAQHAARLAHEAGRLFVRIAARVRSIALVKGPALAAQAWPNPHVRFFDDLDFQCARADYSLLVAALREAGYTPRVADPRRMRLRWHYGWGIGFEHPDGFKVEVNHRFFPPHYPWPRRLHVGRDDLWAPLTIEGVPVRAPAPPLHLLQCGLHAVWHGWERLAWLVDLAGLLARYPNVYAQAQSLVASGTFAQRALTLSVAMANDLLGPDLAQAPSAPPISEAVLQDARRRLASVEPPDSAAARQRFHTQFMTPSERATYRLRRGLIPGDGDFQRLALPMALRGLYWILRPLRSFI